MSNVRKEMVREMFKPGEALEAINAVIGGLHFTGSIQSLISVEDEEFALDVFVESYEFFSDEEFAKFHEYVMLNRHTPPEEGSEIAELFSKYVDAMGDFWLHRFADEEVA